MTKENLKIIVIPSSWQIVVCVSASIIMMVVVYWNVLLDIITRTSHTNPAAISSSFRDYLSNIENLPFSGNIFIVLFWGFTAILIYCAGLVLANVLIDMRNNVVVATRFTKSVKIGKAAGHFLAKVVAAIILVGLLVVSGIVVFPFLIQMMGVSLLAGLAPASIALGIAAICGTAVTLYLIWSLAQIVFKLL